MRKQKNKLLRVLYVFMVACFCIDETPLKEILMEGISVLSTDHAKMGETAAKLILENKQEKIKNPFQLILRKSL